MLFTFAFELLVVGAFLCYFWPRYEFVSYKVGKPVNLLTVKWGPRYMKRDFSYRTTDGSVWWDDKGRVVDVILATKLSLFAEGAKEMKLDTK
jgi:hypothetical protein